MKTVTISEAAHRAVATNTRPGAMFVGGRKLPDGRYEVKLDEEVIDRLHAKRIEGESLSEVIVRIVRETLVGKPRTSASVGAELKHWRAIARLEKKRTGSVSPGTQAGLTQAMADAEAFLAIDDARERPQGWQPPMANPKGQK